MTITLGSPSATPVLLVLGNKNTSGDPTCATGALYYNSNSNQFRSCHNGTWESLAFAPSYTGTLPGSPYDGQEVYYQADATNGVIWHLRYNSGSASAYKWEYLGGASMSSSVATQEATASGSDTDLATVGPDVTLPRAGDYEVTFGDRRIIIPGAAGFSMFTNLYAGVGTPSTGPLCSVDAMTPGGTQNFVVRGSTDCMYTATSASTILRLKYRSGGGFSTSWSDRWIKVTPVRIN